MVWCGVVWRGVSWRGARVCVRAWWCGGGVRVLGLGLGLGGSLYGQRAGFTDGGQFVRTVFRPPSGRPGKGERY